MKSAERSQAGDARPLVGALRLHQTIFLVAISCVMFAAEFPSFNWWPLSFVAIAPLTWAAIHARSTRQVVLVVLVAQFILWLWMNHWMWNVTGPGYVALAAYLSIFPALFAWIIRRASRDGRLACWPMTLLVPITWTGIECLRGELAFDGYPWFLLGHPLIEQPVLAQSADLFGAYFMSVLAAMGSGLIVDVALQRMKTRYTSVERADPRRGLTIQTICFGALIAGDLIYGAWRMGQTDSLTPGPRILAIQTDLPQDNKIGWKRESQERDLKEFIALTRRAFDTELNTGQIDLVAWPETMLPGLGLEVQTQEILARFGESYEYLTRWAHEVVDLSRQLEAPMLVGSGSWVDAFIASDEKGAHLDRRHEYNSAYLIQGPPPYQRYDKTFLTPFGETMPYISHWPWLQEKLLALGAGGMTFSLDANPQIRRLEFHWSRGEQKKTIHLATPICFEDTVGRVCRRMAYAGGRKAADVFVNISNDGWFANSDAGRLQHAQIARFRCIENRLPMIRAVNTGMTIAFDSCGRTLTQPESGPMPDLRTAGHLAASLPLDGRVTLYSRVGDLLAWLCLASTAGSLLWTMVSSRRGPATGTR